MRLVAGAGFSLGASLGGAAAAQATDFTVTAFGDAGDGTCDPILANECTLRDAVDDSNNGMDGDRILFSSSITGTISLGSQLPTIDEALEIVGPGAGSLTVTVLPAVNQRPVYINVPGSEDVTISGLTLTADTPGNGGAILNFDADLTLTDLVIANSVAGGSGGALFSDEGDLIIQRATITGNSADHGGGVYATGGDIGIVITGSTISGNKATLPVNGNGGGVFMLMGALLIDKSTVSGNSAVADGGGVLAAGNTVNPITLKASTISGNGAGSDGGGIQAFDSFPDPALYNAIVANNSAPSGRDVHDTGDGMNAQFSLVESTTGATINASIGGSNLFGVDPQLGALASNGGPTRTHALLATSPAIDRGSYAGPDQRGFARPVDFPGLPNSTAFSANATDIGAFELQRQSCRGQAATVPFTGLTLNDVIVGTPGRDVIRALAGRDIVCGLGGNDLIIGGGAKDILLGQGGRDVIKGSGGNDRLIGGAGRDKLVGGSGRDKLKGGPGRDKQVQ